MGFETDVHDLQGMNWSKFGYPLTFTIESIWVWLFFVVFKTIERIVKKYGPDVCGPQRVNPNYFVDHLNITLVPPVGQTSFHHLCGTKCGTDICGFQWISGFSLDFSTTLTSRLTLVSLSKMSQQLLFELLQNLVKYLSSSWDKLQKCWWSPNFPATIIIRFSDQKCIIWYGEKCAKLLRCPCVLWIWC